MQLARCGAAPAARPLVRGSRPAAARAVSVQAAIMKERGAYTTKGTVRKANEDVFEVSVSDAGPFLQYCGVFDGHGGSATALWLKKELLGYIEEEWQAGNPARALQRAFLAADRQILSANSGLFGMMGERGIGGSKCGATAAVAVVYEEKGGVKLATANCGDARILLVKSDGSVEALFEEHVPDNEAERKRIEKYNPNPKMPLVRFVGGTWRVGGLLALSRAFGDAYLKSSLQFEGVPLGSDGYSSGFGVIAEPYVAVRDLTKDCTHVVVASDGLFNEVQRGGGGGLTNEEVAAMCKSQGTTSSNELAIQMTEKAVEAGSTDDVTVCVLRLDSARLPEGVAGAAAGAGGVGSA